MDFFVLPYPVHNCHLPPHFISINSHVSQHPYRLSPVMFCQFHQGLMTILRSLEFILKIIKHLNGHLTIRENIDVPTFVALFCILNYACLGGLYFCLDYNGVGPKIEEYAPFFTPILHPSTSDLIGLWTVSVPDKVPCFIWGIPILLIKPFRKLKVEWLMFCYLSVILSVPINWVHAPCLGAV